jgi:hypothetical protein
MHRLALPLTVCLWVGLLGLIAWLFHVKAPDPYMARGLHHLTWLCDTC